MNSVYIIINQSFENNLGDGPNILQVPVTTYEELGDVNEEIKMKQLLWDSIVQWDKNIQEWMDVCRWHLFQFIILIYLTKIKCAI